LIQDGIEVITPNPKTSGGARWNYLAAYGFALDRALGGLQQLAEKDAPDLAKAHAEAEAFVTELFRHVPVLDSGARGATTTFAQRGLGDVLLTWENEAALAIQEFGADALEVVVPPLSILAKPPVTIVDAVVDRRGTRALAQAYLEFLYAPEGQRLAAKHHYRPYSPEHASEADLARFPNLVRFELEAVFGSWQAAQETHFADGAAFDRIYAPQAR
jgi:sulfate transport system substrate-binding protein